MKSPVKFRLMRILLDGALHREIDLAIGVGFTKVATIRKWIDSFERAGFIIRTREDRSIWYNCQLNIQQEIILKIYNHPEFRGLRPEIRKAPWFCSLFTYTFKGLPDDLPSLIDDMVIASHTFFETICQNNSPDAIRELYRQTLLPNRLAGIADPVFDDFCIYYQIFLHSTIRDVYYGGLGDGFVEVLGSVQRALSRRAADCVKPC